MAAGPREFPDPDLLFPSGARWRIAGSPSNCWRLYTELSREDGVFSLFKNPRLVNQLRDLASHPLFQLRLDLLYFKAHHHRRNPQWSLQRIGRELEAYLTPGREDWGSAPWVLPRREEEEWQNEGEA